MAGLGFFRNGAKNPSRRTPHHVQRTPQREDDGLPFCTANQPRDTRGGGAPLFCSVVYIGQRAGCCVCGWGKENENGVFSQDDRWCRRVVARDDVVLLLFVVACDTLRRLRRRETRASRRRGAGGTRRGDSWQRSAPPPPLHRFLMFRESRRQQRREWARR